MLPVFCAAMMAGGMMSSLGNGMIELSDRHQQHDQGIAAGGERVIIPIEKTLEEVVHGQKKGRQ